MKFQLLTILFLFSISSIAQMPTGMFKNKPKGKILGKILDEQSKEPVEFASVVLYKLKNDSLITGTLVRRNGDFILDQIEIGAYKIKVSFLGYAEYQQQIILTPKHLDLDIGNIKIKTESKLLDAVQIEAEKVP
jgi:hypothetical protein